MASSLQLNNASEASLGRTANNIQKLEDFLWAIDGVAQDGKIKIKSLIEGKNENEILNDFKNSPEGKKCEEYYKDNITLAKILKRAWDIKRGIKSEPFILDEEKDKLEIIVKGLANFAGQVKFEKDGTKGTIQNNIHSGIAYIANELGINVSEELDKHSLRKKRSSSKDGKKENTPTDKELKLPLQCIWFGAPGTGKSYYIQTALEKTEKDRVFRVTFHPDYDYSSFVGTYRPVKKAGSLTYDFAPQSFAKAYVKAWQLWKEESDPKKKTGKRAFLVIEEINRGNCAQIFGDIFQLLDRKGGFSEYPIDASDELKAWLEAQGLDGIPDYEVGKLKLPPTLAILATMNTSDQSLFPMDSAFKRRFEWRYVPLTQGESETEKWAIVVGNGYKYKWNEFRKKINEKILKATNSEDKQLGPFFAKPDKKENESDEKETVITAEAFVSKVMFFLWNDIAKAQHEANETGDNYLFRKDAGKGGSDEAFFTFNELFQGGGVNKTLLGAFFDKLGAGELKPSTVDTTAEEGKQL